MTALDDLQAGAHTARAGLDDSLAAVADLDKSTEDVAGQFAALGQESSAQILTQGAAVRLATVQEMLANAQRELDTFVDDCERAKGGGG
ncbi:MAG: hypothetical protein GEV10_01030 [Streptosporangiales bacterium]|nr:hypothetical protein [Streptosporangiales bacterium]